MNKTILIGAVVLAVASSILAHEKVWMSHDKYVDEKKGGFTIAPESILAEFNNDVALLKGAVLLSPQSKVHLVTTLGIISSNGADVLVRKSRESIEIYNLTGTANVRLRDGQQFDLAPGFQISLQGVNSEGKIATNTPRPLVLESIIPLLYSSFPGTDSQFMDLIAELKEKRNFAVVGSAHLAQSLIQENEQNKLQEKLDAESLAKQQEEIRQKKKDHFFERSFSR